MNVNKWYSLQIHLSITIMASETHFFSYRGWPVTKICLMNIQKNGIQEYWMFQPPKMDFLECFFCLVWSLSTVNSIICSSTVLGINPLFWTSLDFKCLITHREISSKPVLGNFYKGYVTLFIFWHQCMVMVIVKWQNHVLLK